MKNTCKHILGLRFYPVTRIACYSSILIVLLTAADSCGQESPKVDSSGKFIPGPLQAEENNMLNRQKTIFPSGLHLYDEVNSNGFLKNRLSGNTIVPAILLAGSLSSWHARGAFQQLRNQYLPTFNKKFDDYLQYAPALTVLSLKLSGVKGRYETKRTFVSYAFSALIMAGITNALKYSTKVERPDGSSRNSFPSGHTANAFMNATFLHQQYGDQYWLLSAGGYTSAVLTGAGRQFNNRHWISDVLAGAAIGIASAELGHYLAGKLFKNGSALSPLSNNGSGLDKNGYLGIRMDYRMPLNANNENIYVGPGSGMSIDAGWLVNKYLGIGAEAGLFAHPVFFELSDQHDKVTATGRYLRAGPFFRQELGSDWTLNSRLMFGIGQGSSTVSHQIAIALSKDRASLFNWGVGIDLQKKINQHLSVKTFFNYDSPRKITMTPGLKNLKSDDKIYSSRFHTICLGVGLYALF
ncbi:phosphatase PAP2 family protein [Pedobacter sp. SG908]|uniref:phosphatase PAP2 family protein n=1 Tax=Pedobacter sp. SG908 TaxID=2587135 RepID=UPI00141ED87B|nr:membrane-associated phospholipid phosphatase [Pedobacter sp. SG908]